MTHLPGTGRLILIIISLLIHFNITQKAFAQSKNPQNARIEIEKLTLFKNGLGFIVSSAELPDNTQTVKIGQLPIPSFGTFWVGYSDDVKMKSLITSMEETNKETPVLSIAQLIRLNAGRKVLIHTSDREIEGIIQKSTIQDVQPEVPTPYFMSPRQGQNPYGNYYPPIPANEMISIKTEKGIVVINTSSILRAEFPDDAPVEITNNTQKSPSIRMELEKPAGGKKVTISYLARGITWSPGYLIDLSDPKTAKFNAHAVIINEMTDFDNVKLQLTTGFPNMKFADINNPMAKSQSLAEFLSAFSNNNRYGGNQPIISQQVMLSNVAGADYETYDRALVSGYSTASEGTSAEDMFFYPINNFSLKKDETAWLPLFTAEMPYKHIYTWNINDFVDQNDYYRASSASQDGKSAEEVWHSCRLTNNLSMPLTTASVEFITNNEFTGQDVCYYTPPKAETTIRINKALNVMAEQAEVEIDRKRDAAVFHGYRYDLVKVRGELKIRNRLDKAIKLEISKELSGEVLESSPKSTDTKTAKGLKQVNTKHLLKWEIDLAAGSEKNVSYQYQVYIRE